MHGSLLISVACLNEVHDCHLSNLLDGQLMLLTQKIVKVVAGARLRDPNVRVLVVNVPQGLLEHLAWDGGNLQHEVHIHLSGRGFTCICQAARDHSHGSKAYQGSEYHPS